MEGFRKRMMVFMGLILLGAMMAPTLAYADGYTVTDLGILDDKVSTTVYGNHSINNKGHVVGHCNNGDLIFGLFGDYFTQNVAFLWTKQTGIQALPLLPGAANASAYTLNDRGQIIGIAGNSYLDARLVLWEQGTVRDMGTLPGDTGSFPQAINNHGQIAGVSALWLDEDTVVQIRPALWANGQIQLLPMSGRLGGQANDINEKGQIAGYLMTGAATDHFHSVPVLWDKGSAAPMVLGAPGLGGDWGFAWDINDKGQIVGQAQTMDGEIHAFFWENGVLTDLGTLGGTWASLWAVNNKGQAAGDSTTAGDAADHAILVENGVMYDLNDLIPPASGWVLAFADGINDRGQISGTGILNGEVRGFLLTPKPGM